MTRRRRTKSTRSRAADDGLEEAAATLRGVVEAVRHGELDAPPGMAARLEGAAVALTAMSTPTVPRQAAEPAAGDTLGVDG